MTFSRRFSHKLTHSSTQEDNDAAKWSLIAFANQRRAAAPGKWRWTRSEHGVAVFEMPSSRVSASRFDLSGRKENCEGKIENVSQTFCGSPLEYSEQLMLFFNCTYTKTHTHCLRFNEPWCNEQQGEAQLPNLSSLITPCSSMLLHNQPPWMETLSLFACCHFEWFS